MQWTGLNELREKYLHYFETKDHLRLGSFPLVPKNDPSLLLINHHPERLRGHRLIIRTNSRLPAAVSAAGILHNMR